MFGRKKECETKEPNRFYPRERYPDDITSLISIFGIKAGDGFSTQEDADKYGRQVQYLQRRNHELQSLLDEARSTKIGHEKLIKCLNAEIEKKDKSDKAKKSRKKARKQLKEMRKVVKPGDTFIKLGVEWMILGVRIDGNDVEVDTQSADGSRFIYWYQDLELLKSLMKRNDDPVAVTMNVGSFEIDAPSRGGFDAE